MKLDEVTSLLREIKRGWDAMPDEVKNAERIDEVGQVSSE